MKMSKEKKQEYLAKRYSENKSRALQNKWYSIGRIDLLTIGISGAGIYTVFEIIKFLISQKITANFLTVKVSAFLFVTTILVNFISQYLTWKSNDIEATINNKLFLDVIGNKEKDEKEICLLDAKEELFNKIITWFNISSIVLMTLGLSVLTYFIMTVI